MRILRQFNKFLNCRNYSKDQFQRKTIAPAVSNAKINLPEVEYNTDFLCNPAKRDEIHNNIQRRHRGGDIDKVLQLWEQKNAHEELLSELAKIPNSTDPDVLKYENDPVILKECGVKTTFAFEPAPVQKFGSKLGLLKMEDLGSVAGERAHTFFGDFVELEQALVNYTVAKLLKHNFQLVSVPDILPIEVIKRCGMVMDHDRKLVYELADDYGEELGLSGTAEMALAYLLMNKLFKPNELPLKLAAVSRCFRAEVSSLSKERGLYRVHQFTKVEMFGCTNELESLDMFQKIINIQEEILNELKLYFKVIDMPPHELGSPAYRKVDIEGWLPGKKMFGELTSCSNCTDYQSRRLNIKYEDSDGKLLHVHTLNGTACAIPRMIIAIAETYQLQNGNIKVPEVLVPYMRGKKEITKQGTVRMRKHPYNRKKDIDFL